MKQNTQGFSIVLALGLTVLMSFIGLYLIEYMIPFSRNIVGIENASKAFYQSYGSLEQGILLSYSGGIGYEPAQDVLSTSLQLDGGYVVTSSGTSIPISGRGNSEVNGDWNRISQSESISLLVGNNRLSELNISIRVPDFDGNGSSDTLVSSTDLVLWQLNSTNDSLSVINLLDIPYSRNVFSLSAQNDGYDLSGNTLRLRNFYASNCAAGNECVLKLSVINPLISSGGGRIPYLEYQIQTDGTEIVPFQSSYISASGKSYGFKKDLEILLPHASTNSAFDFTVLQ